MNKLLLIPSAQLVPVELQVEFGAIPTGMIPLHNRPALFHIVERYVERGFECVVAVGRGGQQVQTFLARHAELYARTVDVGATTTLAETILAALRSEAVRPEQLVINFADTYVGDAIPDGDVLCYAGREDTFRWTTLAAQDGRIADIREKGQPKPNDAALPVFVGLFGIADVAFFEECLRRAGFENGNETLDPFYKCIRTYFNAKAEAAGVPVETFMHEVSDWRDFGHIDTYYDTKRAFYSGTRFFNQVAFDARRGIIRKTSNRPRKLISEIKWYLKLPKSLQYIAPRVFDYSVDPDEPFVEMEFYGYPPLNDVYLYGEQDGGSWELFFKALDRLLDEMGAHRYVGRDARELEAAARKIYEGKTYERLEAVIQDDRFRRWHTAESLEINGRCVPGLQGMIARFSAVAGRLRLFDRAFFTVIHGDLCLSNILYDRRNGILRLVDPRGDFGGFDIYGDPLYDLAKLCHSLQGDYDFLVNGLFDLEWKDDRITLQPHLTDRHRLVKQKFERWIRKRAGDAYLQVKLIESLLFLSMVPLHADRYRSQQAFLARGLDLFDRVACRVEEGTTLSSNA